MTSEFPPTRIVSEHAAFMQSGVVLDVATRDHANLPFVTIACGCRAAGSRVTVFINRVQARKFLLALTGTHAIAVTFGRPSDHRSLQIKGRDAEIHDPLASDTALMRAYVEALAADMQQFGATRQLTVGFVNLAANECVAVSFTPYAAFDQTPGPSAGLPLSSP